LAPRRRSGWGSELARDPLGQGRDVEAGLLQKGLDDSFRLGQQGGKEMGIIGHRIAPLACHGGGVPEGLLSLDGQSFWADHGRSVSVSGSLARLALSAQTQPPYPKPLPDWQK
jgi:hypothetical protein